MKFTFEEIKSIEYKIFFSLIESGQIKKLRFRDDFGKFNTYGDNFPFGAIKQKIAIFNRFKDNDIYIESFGKCSNSMTIFLSGGIISINNFPYVILKTHEEGIYRFPVQSFDLKKTLKINNIENISVIEDFSKSYTIKTKNNNYNKGDI